MSYALRLSSFCGGSPSGTLGRTIEQEWGQDLIKSWNSAGWFEMPLRGSSP